MDENRLLTETSDVEVLEMMNDTSRFMADYKLSQLSSAAVAAQNSGALVDEVEFWKWMGRNFSGKGIFESSLSMQQYLSQGIGKEEWLVKQLQGKGYEWDWMQKQRGSLKGLFNSYDAGDVANRAASDVTEHSLLTGNNTEYQMKAYTSKNTPHLDNTPKDMKVVTNAEKVDVVKRTGYNNVESFQDSDAIVKSTNDRLKAAKDGSANVAYSFKNVAGTMVKAGVVGCVIGMGIETMVSYKSWKNGQLSDEEYLKEILKAGGDAGVTSAITAGIMVPITAAITAAGVTSVITIPIAFVIGSAVNRVVAPCFGRGKYREILQGAKYYQYLEDVYDDLIFCMKRSSEEYCNYINTLRIQSETYDMIKSKSTMVDNELVKLYDSI